jgi:hypothetical protein
VTNTSHQRLQCVGYSLSLPSPFHLLRDPNLRSSSSTTSSVAAAHHGHGNDATWRDCQSHWLAPSHDYSFVFEIADGTVPPIPPPSSMTSPLLTSPTQSLDDNKSLGSPDSISSMQTVMLSAAQFRLRLHSLSVSSASASSTLTSTPSISSNRSIALHWPLDIESMTGGSGPQQRDLYMSLSFPSTSSIGESVAFTLTIHRLRLREPSSFPSLSSPTSTPLLLCYQLTIDPTMWLMMGKPQATFSLQAGEQQSFTLKLLPIVCGYLPIPAITLFTVAPPLSSSSLSRTTSGNNAATGSATGRSRLDDGNDDGAFTRPSSRVPHLHSISTITTSAMTTTGRVSVNNSVGIPSALERVPLGRILRHAAAEQIQVYPLSTMRTGLRHIEYIKS